MSMTSRTQLHPYAPRTDSVTAVVTVALKTVTDLDARQVFTVKQARTMMHAFLIALRKHC